MTTMLPERPVENTTKSEKAVFNLIRDSAGTSGWYCLHSVGLARHRRKAYGEADFIVVCPKGVFCLEAKGGHVSRSGGQWTIGWPGNSYTSGEGPFKQAQGTIHPLMSEIESRLSKAFRNQVLFGWGVVFPDIRFSLEDPEWDLRSVFDTDSKSDFAGFIEELAKLTREREAVAGREHKLQLSGNEIDRIVKCFRRDFDLVPRISDLISESQSELAELSEQQYSVLRFALDPLNPRVLCPGAAGTGKTLIGVEAARRLGRGGKRVLLVCFNRLLATHLNREISHQDGDIEVWSLHRFMRHVIGLAGMSAQLSEEERRTQGSVEFFTQSFPNLFETAMLTLDDEDAFDLYDMLIVDEGQDILFSPVIDTFGLVLKGGLEGGNWLLLYDPDLQSEIYGKMDPNVLDMFSKSRSAFLPLAENFRNPEAIVDEMCTVTGVKKPECRRKLVTRVDYRTCKDDAEQPKKLRALLIELIKEGVPPGSVTVLSSRKKEASCIYTAAPEIGKKILHIGDGMAGHPSAEDLTACSVSAFKGMENDIIILTDIPDSLSDDPWTKSVMYVGMTRARTRLYAIVTDGFMQSRLAKATAGATDHDRQHGIP